MTTPHEVLDVECWCSPAVMIMAFRTMALVHRGNVRKLYPCLRVWDTAVQM